VVIVTPRPRFTPGERTPGTHCTGGWVGQRLEDTEVRGKKYWNPEYTEPGPAGDLCLAVASRLHCAGQPDRFSDAITVATTSKWGIIDFAVFWGGWTHQRSNENGRPFSSNFPAASDRERRTMALGIGARRGWTEVRGNGPLGDGVCWYHWRKWWKRRRCFFFKYALYSLYMQLCYNGIQTGVLGPLIDHEMGRNLTPPLPPVNEVRWVSRSAV
jgi:hypothetical protein